MSQTDEQFWVQSLRSVKVRDLKGKDDVKKMSFIVMYSLSKQGGLKRKRPQWVVLVQFVEGGHNVRYVFAADKEHGKMIPVRTDYLPARKWMCKYLGDVDMSMKRLLELVNQNPLNGAAHKEHKKRPMRWANELCKLIKVTFADTRLWDTDTFDYLADLAETSGQHDKDWKTSKERNWTHRKVVN